MEKPMTRLFVMAAALLSLALISFDQRASRAAEAQRADNEASSALPRIELRVAKTSYDATTGTLTLDGVGRVDVYDAAGKIHHMTYDEFPALTAHPASHRNQQGENGFTIRGKINGEGYEQKVESFSHDLKSQSMSLKLSSGAQLKTIRGDADATTVVFGPVPTRIVCCDCDWKCSVAWVIASYCATCASGTVGASSCCQVCGLPAVAGGTCP